MIGFGKKIYRTLILVLMFIGMGLILNACSTGFFLHKDTNDYGENGKVYKIGNPYRIDGKVYTPKEDYSYNTVGIASWYGPNFNGGPTANGGRYDMYGISAAHKTLPLPSIVLVTNLKNGKSLKVKINDRGPYVKDRIIDLSYHTAKILGMTNKGTGKVRVQVLPAESRALKDYMLSNGKRGYSLKSPYDPVPKQLYEEYGSGYIPPAIVQAHGAGGAGGTGGAVKKPVSSSSSDITSKQAASIKFLKMHAVAKMNNIYWIKTQKKIVHHSKKSNETYKLPQIPDGNPGKQRLLQSTTLDPKTLN